ncbi:hypothetical protein BLNAU_8578 [Blattamonas nauphoetae]|uniref:Uncharacterized protein n=1 Tax=Blattamonas nauphoetae TaxID=2049346 RepID=A0ABQ9XYI8_9EUKA|nr:hypothetical protein BLNAU_8578 [Blattamonas nauphoetae]
MWRFRYRKIDTIICRHLSGGIKTASPHSPTDRPAAPPQPEEHLRLAFELSADSVIDTCCDAAIWKKGPIVSIDTFSRVECTGLAKNTDHGNSSLAWKNA